MKWFKSYISRVNQPVDARVYALFRIAFSFFCFINFLNLLQYRAEFFSNKGMIDAVLVSQGVKNTPYYSLFYDFNSPTAITLIFGITGISIILMGLGLFTRIFTGLVFLWQVSYRHLLFTATSGWDDILTIYSFLLLVSPQVDQWSLDGLIKKRWKNQIISQTAPAYGLYLMRFQILMIYWGAILLRQGDIYWYKGEFVAYYMLSVYSRFPYPVFAEVRFLSALLTYGTVICEFLIPLFLLSKKYKRVGVALSVALHVGILIVSPLDIFSPLMIALSIPCFNQIHRFWKSRLKWQNS